MSKDDVRDFAESMAEWAIERWDAEVKNRPPQNVYRHILDRHWRQVYRRLTGGELPREVDAKEEQNHE